MKFSLDRKEFINTLRIGGAFAGKYRALPILDNVKVTIKGDHIVISSYDNENAITKRMQIIESSEDTSFCITPKILMNALKSLKEGVVEIEITERLLNLKHKKGEITLPIEPSDEFLSPIMENVEENFEISSETLYDWMSSAVNFVSDDTLRPVMNGIYLYFENNEFGICASDGHKMFTDNMDYNYPDSEVKDAIISSKSVSALLEMINGTEKTIMKIGDVNVTFSTSDSKIICRKIEGRYPNFKSVMPKDNNIVISVGKQDFLESLNRVSITANSTSSLIRFNADGTIIRLSSEDIDFSMKSCDEMFCEKEGGDITIGFKGNFLKQCVDSVSSEKITFEMSEPSRAAIIKDDKQSNRTLLLMPMMLNS